MRNDQKKIGNIIAMAESGGDEMEGVFSVWAMPAPDRRRGFLEVMNKLREEFGGPSFDPHVTVVGAQRLTKAQACANLEAACRTIKPYTCRLQQVACGKHFYQCVYMLVDPTPQVMQANLHASRCFGILENPRPYMPHLSLLYGDLSDKDKQEAKAKAEGFNHLICNTEFEVSSFCLYRTDTEDKSLNSWEKVAECNLETCNEK
eukprot:Gb_07676 [translate_table: standard]